MICAVPRQKLLSRFNSLGSKALDSAGGLCTGYAVSGDSLRRCPLKNHSVKTCRQSGLSDEADLSGALFEAMRAHKVLLKHIGFCLQFTG